MIAFGLVGRKVGMTRVFADDGSATPVTILDVSKNHITQMKFVEKDGYSAIQIAHGTRKVNRLKRSDAGHFAKAGVEASCSLHEFKVDPEILEQFKLGDPVGVECFTENQLVDATGVSKGKGFSGVIKRYHFSSNRASHGNSRSHRSPGSIGQNQDPGRVFPGKRMAGQLGNVQRTVQCLKVLRVDTVRQLLFLKGAVPGSNSSRLVIRPSVKGGK